MGDGMMNDRPLTGEENAMLDADLALLSQSDPAPEISGALMARILGDAADAAPRPGAAAPSSARRPASPKPGFWSSLGGFWQPVSAGFAAAALGVWIGWADPAGVTAYANPFETATFASDIAIDDLDEYASLLDMEL